MRSWLLASFSDPIPTSADQVLDYLKVAARAGKRTSLASVPASLRFLEEAGEVREADRLSNSAAILNAGKEHAICQLSILPVFVSADIHREAPWLDAGFAVAGPGSSSTSRADWPRDCSRRRTSRRL